MNEPSYTPPPPETIRNGSSTGALPEPPTEFRPPPQRPVPQREQLAEALYLEFCKKRYDWASPYPWEHVSAHHPDEARGWLAVADMAILNLCS